MAVTITLTPGTLTAPTCYATEQARFDAYVAKILATVSGGIQWVAASVNADTSLYWLKLDGANRPLYALQYVAAPDAAFVPWLGQVIYGDDTGAANAYILTPVPAFTNSGSAYQTGRKYIFKALNANTTTSTVNVSGLGAKTIKKLGGTANLDPNDIVVGQLVEIVYDGTNFQMQSQPGAAPPREVIVYATVAAANPADLIFTKPAGKRWTRIDVKCKANIQSNGGGAGGSVRGDFTWQTAPIVGVTPAIAPGNGAGNLAFVYALQNSDDNNAPDWEYIGAVPSDIYDVNTITFRTYIAVVSGAGAFTTTTTSFGQCAYI